MPIFTDGNLWRDPINARIGQGQSYAEFAADGSLGLSGSATAWEDLRIDAITTRTGVVAPTDEVGFRGNSNHYTRNFVHTQADEVQFTIQMPHAWRVNSQIYPHVHFSPYVSGSNGNQATFVLELYPAQINAQFPATTASYAMTASFSGNKQWYHLIADTASGISSSTLGISGLMKCRLYRDNTGACNLQGKIAFLYFDIHYEVDSFGSQNEYSKI